MINEEIMVGMRIGLPSGRIAEVVPAPIVTQLREHEHELRYVKQNGMTGVKGFCATGAWLRGWCHVLSRKRVEVAQ